MKKSDKKIDNAIISSLTEACETAKTEIEGFDWLTHTVDFNHFPESLNITCVFDTNHNLSKAFNNHQDMYLLSLINEKLNAVGIHLKQINKHVCFDSEESCLVEDKGKWSVRLNANKTKKFSQNKPQRKLH